MTAHEELDRHHATDGSAFLRCRSAASERLGTLVLIHGLGESGLCFERIWSAESLASWDLLCWDLLGYGKSSWPAAALALDDHARFLRARLRAAHESGTLAGPVVLVGHSMGGVIATLMCEQRGADDAPLDGVVNVEGNVSLSDCTLSATAAAQSAEVWCRNGQNEAADVLYLEGVEELASRTYYASLKLCDPRTFHLNSRELVDLSRREELALRQAATGVACSYVYGDPGGTGSHSRSLLHDAGIPVHGVRHSGHWPFVDHPDEFLEILSTCITEVVAPSASNA